MEDTVASRLKLFIDTSGLAVSEFADMCGIPRPTLSQILSGRNKKISDVLVGQIHRTFPDLSILWLLFGEGPVKVDVTSGGERLAKLQSSEESASDSSENTGNFVKSRDADKGWNKNENVRGLNVVDNAPNSSANQIFTSDLKILDLQGQIDQMKKNPRKVLQITIYYDDSTFETFIPK